jgi:hypothetical protein
MIVANRPLIFHPRLRRHSATEYAELVERSMHRDRTYTAEDIFHAVTATFPRAGLQPSTVRTGILRAAQLGTIVQAGRQRNARNKSCQLWRLQ